MADRRNRNFNVNLNNPAGVLGMDMDDLNMEDFDLHELEHVLHEANNYDQVNMGELDEDVEYELEAGDGDEGSEDPDSFYHESHSNNDNNYVDPSTSSWQHQQQPRQSHHRPHHNNHLSHHNNNSGELSTNNTAEFQFFDNLLTMSSSPSEVERRMEEYWSMQSSSSSSSMTGLGKDDETHVNFSDLDQEVPDWRSHWDFCCI